MNGDIYQPLRNQFSWFITSPAYCCFPHSCLHLHSPFLFFSFLSSSSTLSSQPHSCLILVLTSFPLPPPPLPSLPTPLLLHPHPHFLNCLIPSPHTHRKTSFSLIPTNFLPFPSPPPTPPLPFFSFSLMCEGETGYNTDFCGIKDEAQVWSSAVTSSHENKQLGIIFLVLIKKQKMSRATSHFSQVPLRRRKKKKKGHSSSENRGTE